jgi:hypothetical protein
MVEIERSFAPPDESVEPIKSLISPLANHMF